MPQPVAEDGIGYLFFNRVNINVVSNSLVG